MCTVIISAHFEDEGGEDAFVASVEALLRGLGSSVCKHADEDADHVIITATQKQAPPPVPPPDSGESLPVVPPMDIPSDPALLATIEAQPDLTEVCLLNLSGVCRIPFVIERSLPCSELKVQGLTSTGDFASFVYCDMSYRLPVEKAGMGPLDTVCNQNPLYSNSSIRVLAEMRAGASPLSMLVKLVETAPEEKSKLFFGSDVADLVAEAMELPNGI